jgi:hypothetical protein
VWDFVPSCKRNDILIQGRDSDTGSAVCYALEITAINVSRQNPLCCEWWLLLAVKIGEIADSDTRWSFGEAQLSARTLGAGTTDF